MLRAKSWKYCTEEYWTALHYTVLYHSPGINITVSMLELNDDPGLNVFDVHGFIHTAIHIWLILCLYNTPGQYKKSRD